MAGIMSSDSNRESARRLGALQVAAAGFCFGFLGIFGRLAFDAGLTLGSLLTLRFLLASALLAVGVALFRPRLLMIDFKQLLGCLGLGVLGYAVFASLYFTAIEGVSVALASLLLYTFPVWVAIGAHFGFKERLTKRQWAALPLTAAGLAFLVGGNVLGDLQGSSHGSVQGHSTFAIACGLGSALSYATYILVSSRIQASVHPLTSGIYVMLAAAIGLWVIHQPDASSWLELDAKQISVVFGLAFVSTVLPLTLFLSGLQKLGNTQASLLSTVEPVTAALLGAVILGETLGLRELVGGATILVALAASTLDRRA